MSRESYYSVRGGWIRVFGIIMLALGILTGAFGGIHTQMVYEHSTAVTTGTVVGVKYREDDDGESIRHAQISYTLPDGHWLVLMQSEDLEVGDEVNVYYNPDNPEEKYIEGLGETPWYYVTIGACGAVLGIVCIALSGPMKRNTALNQAVDFIDNPSGRRRR